MYTIKCILILFVFWIIKIHCYVPSQTKWLLNDGHIMPPIALGTYGKTEDVEKVGKAVEWAIEAGYRHIDTSYLYLNERVIGESIKRVIQRGIVTREELFVTTKLDTARNRKSVLPSLRKSLENLQLEYVDLYLIHSAYNLTGGIINYLDIWKGMEEVKRSGLTRSIGISNFNSSQINDILLNSEIRPAVSQIEINPTYTNLDLAAYCQSQGMRVMSYSPFGFMVPRPFQEETPPPQFDNPVLVKIAQKYRKTTNEVAIRYLVDRETIPIPRSTNKQHIISNINIFDFSLTAKEVYMINIFNLNKKVFNEKYVSEEFIQYYFGMSKKEFIAKYYNE